MNYNIINGDNLVVLKDFPDNHFDSIVTDPPYGISFLGKGWDEHTGLVETYKECLRVLKPGGHLLAFSAARTYHRLATSIEDAGFEIRDQIMWIYSSGFPKSQDVGKSIQRRYDSGFQKEIAGDDVVCTSPEAKEWAGWGTQLKPAHEPIVLARKPIKQSIAKNCQEYGTGALNIDDCRILYESEADKNAIDHKVPTSAWSGHTIQTDSYESGKFIKIETNDKGRFPSNVIGELPDYQKYFYKPTIVGEVFEIIEDYPKFKYCPKVSRNERHLGFNTTTIPTNPNGNNHPTVKPIALMDYLIRLVTKKGGKVLDPFNGSGSTGCAAVKAGYDYTGIELDPKYVEISKKRIEAYCKEDNNFNDLFEEEE